MRTSGLTLAVALSVTQGAAVAQSSWSDVKSWTGSVTIEATESQKGAWGTSKLTYKATGDFTIADDMLPAGSHMQWPMPSVEAMSDPRQAETVYDRWQARVVASYDANRVNERGEPFTIRCAADNQQAAKGGVTMHPTEPTFVLEVSPPLAKFKCSDTSGMIPDGRLQQASLRLTAPRKPPGAISGTETFTVGTSTIKVTYSMAPSR